MHPTFHPERCTQTPLDPDQCWAAICNRTPANFIYGVLTTGICCRPGCASRRPRADNVRYFTCLPDALAAGFRPCKRCRPEHDLAHINARIERLCRFIETAEEIPTLATLAAYAGISRYHLQRQFKQITGMTPKVYARTHHRSVASQTPPRISAKASLTTSERL